MAGRRGVALFEEGGGVSRVSGIRTCIARESSGSTATLNINKLNLLDYKAGTASSLVRSVGPRDGELPGRKVPTEEEECARKGCGGRKKELPPNGWLRLRLEPSGFVYFRRFVRVAKWVGLIALK